jgi:hypothetical protein
MVELQIPPGPTIIPKTTPRWGIEIEKLQKLIMKTKEENEKK